MCYKLQTIWTIRVLLKSWGPNPKFGKPEGPSVYFTLKLNSCTYQEKRQQSHQLARLAPR
ncbi:hypothetical protein HanIR_Chr16g0789201 [Helianthus annuus]|nr:hypothetical protein HanIR_Chr16g0789201 [Helianthus annuus]